MRPSNEFSKVASSAIERVQKIASRFVNSRLPQEAVDSLCAELDCHRKTLEKAFEFRKIHGPARSMADSDVYFCEKLGAMIDFAKMAVNPALREGYSAEKIIENIGHYSYLTADLVSAEWNSVSRRPKTDRTLKDSSLDNREALQRLANR